MVISLVPSRKSGGGRQQVNLWLCEGQEDRITVVVVHDLSATPFMLQEIALVKCARGKVLGSETWLILRHALSGEPRTSCNDRLLQALLAVRIPFWEGCAYVAGLITGCVGQLQRNMTEN